VQSAVDTTNHLIVAHEVTNVGTDRSQLATMAQAAKAALRSDNLDVVADRGYFKGEEILVCEQSGVAVTLPKPQTSGAKSAGRFGKPDFVYLAKDDVYRCPAGEKLEHRFTADEDGQKMRIDLTKACRTCPLKDQCTTYNERRIKRWEHEHVVEAAQTRLDQNPRQRSEIPLQSVWAGSMVIDQCAQRQAQDMPSRVVVSAHSGKVVWRCRTIALSREPTAHFERGFI